MKKINTDKLLTIIYFALYLLIGLSLLIKQPFGNPPDEYNRYLIPEYIVENGTLPNGFEESIRIGGYGFSYAFQPILPYMLQGYTMKIVSLFTDSEIALLYTGRAVNLLLGGIMAWFVLKLSKEWFTDRRFGWLFALLVTFLPQSIFIHTYVNTDSCCMLSIAIMLYGLTLGLKSGFTRRTSIILSLGIILCALSYYNAYGYILSCILLFTASFLSANRGTNGFRFDFNGFLKKGLFISALVLLGIGWWFIRSAILYDGDFLGLETRHYCATLYAIPEFHPDTMVTWKGQGYSLWDMMTTSDFWNLSTMSFIGAYGCMTITTSIWVYRFYKLLFFAGIFLSVILPVKITKDSNGLFYQRKGLSRFYHANMIFCMVMPLILSLYYSYSTDYQPQGRYLLPALIPFCYYTIRGFEKLWNLNAAQFFQNNTRLVQAADTLRKDKVLTTVVTILCVLIALWLFVTVYGYAFPYYEANPIAP